MKKKPRASHLGTPGHFCGGASCVFHLHTHVNNKCISTVGEYYPRGWDRDEPEKIGLDRFYETMVFTLDKDGEHNGDNEYFAAYDDRDDANRGHAKVVCKYIKELSK
jgi:hypothetical protein